MGEKETIIKEMILYAGLCDFRGCYSFMHDWFKDEGYGVTEDSYTEKVKGDVKEIVVKWTIKKTVSDYYKAEIIVKISVQGMKDVEVEVDGTRKKMNQVDEIKIELKGILEVDHQNKWGKRSTSRFMKDLYHKYIVPERTDEMKGKIKDTIQDFKEEVKAFLELTGKK